MMHSIIFLILFGYVCLVSADAAEFAVARTPAPVLNSPDFQDVFGGRTGNNLKTDRCGQVRELEYIAVPGTVFTLVKKLRFGSSDIYQVEIDEYKAPPNVRLYVDSRFLRMEGTMPEPRRPLLPSREKIAATLKASVGKPYVWGGNAVDGVPELAAWFYKDSGAEDGGRHVLAGLDCSGLLYHASGGWTPRNTSHLTAFGQGVAVAGKRSTEIAALLQPLDIIVWNGHVIIVLDHLTAIESRLECGKSGNGGVVMTPLLQRIAAVMRTRRPVDTWQNGTESRNTFVVRRWYAQP